MRANRVAEVIRTAVWSTARRRIAALFGVLAVVGVVTAVVVLLLVGGGGERRQAVARPTATPTIGGPWEKLDVPSPDERYSLKATSEDEAGVKADSAFVFTSTEQLSESALSKRLTSEPALALDLHRENEHEVRIVPREPLQEGQVYHFSLRAEAGDQPLRSWAFQAASPLRVVETLPRDLATDVPLDSGIEVTFSHDGVTAYESRITIDPPVEGRFELHKRVVVFVPKELQPATLYTVTVHAGIGLDGSDLTLQEDQAFRFETGTGGPDTPYSPVFQFSRRTFEMPTGEPPILAMFTSDSAANITASFSVYRFAGADKFVDTLHQLDDVPVWTRFARGRFHVDTSGLPQVATFQGELQTIGRYGDLYVRFPEALPEGFYLVEAAYHDARVQGWLQVTDIATYTSVSRTRSLVWANDLRTQGPLVGASIAMTDGTQINATTDAQGVAYFDTPPNLVELQPSAFGYTTSKLVSDVIVRAPDGRVAVVPLENVFDNYRYFGFREYAYSGDPGLYWRFLFTDRHLYLPTDSVHFWGLVRPRESAPGERDVTVRIAGGNYDYGYAPQTVAEATIKTSPSGTLIGELPLVDVSPGYYTLSIIVDNQVVSSIYFEVQDYVKPAYKIDVTTSRSAVIAGDRVDYRINASFFDGSPLPNAVLHYSGPAEGDVVTDVGGNATISAAPRGDTYGYGADQFNVVPKQAEEGEITGSAWVRVFPAALMLDSESDIEGGQARLSGTVYNVDLDRLNRDDAARYDDPRGAPAAIRTVSADVVEVTYAREEAGETYDFISKRVEKLYNYREVSSPLGVFTATSASDGRFDFTWPADREKNYRVVLSVKDEAGRAYTQETYVYDRGNVYYDSRVYVADVTASKTGPSDPYAYGGSYATGERVTMALQQSSGDLPSGGANRYLFYTGQNGLRGFTVQSDSRYGFTFGDDDVPSVSVMGVRFTGATYQESSFPYVVRFDPSERELKITVESDKERYAPGDEATLRVTTTDRDGKPLAAEVNLSAVDEAVFRIEGPYDGGDRQILSTLYTPVDSGILRTYASHFYPFENNAAERGGDGGPRNNFKDVALFDRVHTGSDGKASISFKLPDNLTSWRITALGVSDNLLAGYTLKAVPVGLPFFVDATMNRDYLLSDRPSIRLRAFGMELTTGEDVTFELSAPSLGIDEPIHVDGQAFTPVDVPLPELREGTHDLLIKASAGDRSDSLVRTINVVPSRLSRTEARFYELAPDTQLQGSVDRATDVIFSDQNRGRYYPLLQNLTWTWGDRVDQMLARDLAQDLLHQYFGEDSGQDSAEFRASLYQSPKGGIGLFPYADADLVLSARLADVAPDRFGRQTLLAYFLGVTNDMNETRERTIIATYGLAAMGEPVLPDVQAFARLTDLTWRERLYVGLAAGALGDDDTASQVYRALLNDFGQRRGPWVRLNVGVDEDDILEATSMLAILGADIGDDLAPAIFGYASDNYTRDILVQLEQISYLRRALPRLPAEPVRFEYVVDGKRHEATLQRGETLRLRLTPSQLAELAPRPIEGNVGVATFFLAPFDPAAVTLDPAVSVRRRIETLDGGPMADGKLVKVTLDYDVGPQAVDGCYQVSDLVPSGLRPVTRFYSWDIGSEPSPSYPYAILGQRISFCVGKVDPQHYRPVIYYARVVGKGSYLAEPAIIQSQKAPDSINLTPAERIEIQ